MQLQDFVNAKSLLYCNNTAISMEA